MKIFLPIALAFSFTASLSAQMPIGGDTLFGNEWIKFGDPYFKILVGEDGIYRIPTATMSAAGVPSSVAGSRFQLFRNGREIPIFVSTDGPLGNADFIEFFGQKNRIELDSFLFLDKQTILNQEYGIYTDSTAYFLTWTNVGQPLRYQNEVNDLTNPPIAEPYVWCKTVFISTNQYKQKSLAAGEEHADSYFEDEGFSSGYGFGSNNAEWTHLTPAVFSAGPSASLSVRYLLYVFKHNQQMKMNGALLGVDTSDGSRVRVANFSIAANKLTYFNQMQWLGLGGSHDVQSIASSVIRYPRLLDANGEKSFHFWLETNGQSHFLPFIQLNSVGNAPILLDLTARKRLVGVVENSIAKWVLPALAAGQHEFFIAGSDGGIREIQSMQPVVFTDFKNANADFVLLSHATFFEDKTDPSHSNWVKKWADYRETTVGGSHKSLVVDVQQVYDQFGWGLNRHAQAIKNFCFFMVKNWPAAHYLTLVGKPKEIAAVRSPSQFADAGKNYFMPTFGEPMSDQLFSAPLGSVVPKLAIGRIAAQNPSEIKAYFEKLVEFENTASLPQTITAQAWKKRVLQISGGGINEITTLRNYTEQLKNVLTNSKMGAECTIFSKTSTDPIQTSPSAAIVDLMNAGISIFQIYGHSNPLGFDYAIDEDNLKNKGKYPIFFGFGCYSGNCAVSGEGIGERFILPANKGAVGFFATSGLGYLSDLQPAALDMYDKIGNSMYGQTIGDITRKSTAQLAQPVGTVGINQFLQQNVYQGDPAIRVVNAPSPDFLIDETTLRVKPDPVSIERDSFEIAFDLLNLGQNLGDSVFLKAELKSPTGQTVPLAVRFLGKPKALRTAFKLNLPTPVSNKMSFLGFNRLLLTVDPSNKIVELPDPSAEANNQLLGPDGLAGATIYFFGNDVMPVRPTDLSILTKPKIELAASTLNLYEPAQNFYWQIDTTALFNSPLLENHSAKLSGGLLEWSPTIQLVDSTVYYWRISRDTAGLGFLWHEQSFLFKNKSPEGWNEDHYFQFKRNEFPADGSEQLHLIDSTRRLSFGDFQFELSIKMGRADQGGPHVEYKSQGMLDALNPYELGVAIMLFNPIDGALKFAPANDPNNVFGTEQPFYSFTTADQTGRGKLIDFLKNKIPSGWYACFLTATHVDMDYLPKLWAADSTVFGNNIFQLLEHEGAKLIRKQAVGAAGLPYAFVYKKGSGKPLLEADYNGSELSPFFRVPIFYHGVQGKIVSPLIGPAKKWGQLDWKMSELDASDLLDLKIIGVKKTGFDSVLLDGLKPSVRLLDDLSATEFPKIRLEINAMDDILHSAPQLKRLRVLYESVPEGYLSPSVKLFEKDSVQQGEPMKIAAMFKHLDGGPMDSLLLKMTVRDALNQNLVVSKRLKTLPVGDSILIKQTFDTKQLVGNQQLTLDVNPDGDQPEQFHFNNVVIQNFQVRKDKINPLLDVTFDGQHLLDGDLISPKPEIFISLKDENRWLALSDTALLSVVVRRPDSSLLHFYFDGSDATAQFFPADASNLNKKNEAQIRLTPHFTKDGEYELMVTGRDATGNASGSVGYKIRFEVITKSSISSLLNYPNPFSTRTCFAYTMTGEATPAHFKVQIMTISGKIVREITENEFGPLRAGRHLSDFCWDGHDEFGDQLANGVYLYRIVAKKADGSDFDHFENKPTDGFFKNGWGKMVLIR